MQGQTYYAPGILRYSEYIAAQAGSQALISFHTRTRDGL
jgi:hypothetical protein